MSSLHRAATRGMAATRLSATAERASMVLDWLVMRLSAMVSMIVDYDNKKKASVIIV
jgi:lysine/ornithine N-monooxygenase